MPQRHESNDISSLIKEMQNKSTSNKVQIKKPENSEGET